MDSTGRYADVAIHCGDLTAESNIDEYRASVQFLWALNAPLKLVIAGNHDFTLDILIFQKKEAEARPPLDSKLIEQYTEAIGRLDGYSTTPLALLSSTKVPTFSAYKMVRLRIFTTVHTYRISATRASNIAQVGTTTSSHICAS